jgi:hypothetical protein
MNTLCRVFGIERLAEHAPPAHGRGVGVLPRVATNRCSCRSDQQCATTAASISGNSDLG